MKIKVGILSLCLLLSVAYTYSNDTTNKADKDIPKNDTEIIATINEEETPAINSDEFDALVDAAIDQGALTEEIIVQKPSQFEILLRRVAIVLILKPYITFIQKYRACKAYFSEYLHTLLHPFSKKEQNAGEQN